MKNANCTHCGKAHRTDHKSNCPHFQSRDNLGKRPTVLLWQCGLAPQPAIKTVLTEESANGN